MKVKAFGKKKKSASSSLVITFQHQRLEVHQTAPNPFHMTTS